MDGRFSVHVRSVRLILRHSVLTDTVHRHYHERVGRGCWVTSRRRTVVVVTYGVLVIQRTERLTSIICEQSAARPVRAAGSSSTGTSSHALTCAGPLKETDCTSLRLF